MFFPATRRLLRRPGCFLTILALVGTQLLLSLTVDCWFPSQGRSDLGTSAFLAIEAIHKKEAAFHAAVNRFATLSELGLDTTLAHPYRITLETTAHTYQLWADPPPGSKRLSLCCCFGSAPLNSYYSDQSRIIRVERGCRRASPASRRY